jgi:hypothetical protein
MTTVLWGSKKSDTTKTSPPASTRQTQGAVPSKRPETSTGVGLLKHPTDLPQKTVPRDELPRFLVSEGHISEEQVRYALKVQQETGVFFGEVLAKEGVLGNQSLVSYLAKNCKIPHIGLLDYLIDKSLFALIPEELCWKYHLLPVDKMGRNLTIAMVNPLNNAAIQAVQAACPDLRIKPILCSHDHFGIVAKKLFGNDGEDHDDSSWADVPVAEDSGISEASVAVAPTTSTVVQAEDATPQPVDASPEAIEDEGVIPVESPVSGEAQAEESVTRNNDKLLESVFGTISVHDLAAKEGDVSKNEKELTPSEMSTLESVMHTYTNAMVNSMHDTYELLARKISFFNGVSPEDVAKIFAQGNVVEYDPAEMLFDKGDNGETMFVILNGRVKIRDGAKQIAILQTGDIFGEMALVSNAPRSATAVTMTQSDLLVLSFEDILHKLPSQVAAQLLVNIIITLADRLRSANQD